MKKTNKFQIWAKKHAKRIASVGLALSIAFCGLSAALIPSKTKTASADGFVPSVNRYWNPLGLFSFDNFSYSTSAAVNDYSVTLPETINFSGSSSSFSSSYGGLNISFALSPVTLDSTLSFNSGLLETFEDSLSVARLSAEALPIPRPVFNSIFRYYTLAITWRFSNINDSTVISSFYDSPIIFTFNLKDTAGVSYSYVVAQSFPGDRFVIGDFVVNSSTTAQAITTRIPFTNFENCILTLDGDRYVPVSLDDLPSWVTYNEVDFLYLDEFVFRIHIRDDVLPGMPFVASSLNFFTGSLILSVSTAPSIRTLYYEQGYDVRGTLYDYLQRNWQNNQLQDFVTPIFNVVENFLNFEVFPYFKLSYILMFSLGLLLFGFVLKFFLGG